MQVCKSNINESCVSEVHRTHATNEKQNDALFSKGKGQTRKMLQNKIASH
jgi:hypothetical protein